MKTVEIHNQAEYDAHKDDANTLLVISGNATVEAWDNATVHASDNATVEAWENATVRASGNATVHASGNATVEASGYATVRARGNATVEAWWNVVIRRDSESVTIKQRSPRVRVVDRITILSTEDWLTCHGRDPDGPAHILYKRVSQGYLTQEGTSHETAWRPGTTVVHPAWAPANNECGAGKFHACAMPWMADEFRNEEGDRYVAIQVNQDDLYAWRGIPTYPNKIAFRVGRVLHECDRDGNKIEAHL